MAHQIESRARITLRIKGKAPALTQNTGARPTGRSFAITATAIDNTKKISEIANSKTSNSSHILSKEAVPALLNRSQHPLLSIVRSVLPLTDGASRTSRGWWR